MAKDVGLIISKILKIKKKSHKKLNFYRKIGCYKKNNNITNLNSDNIKIDINENDLNAKEENNIIIEKEENIKDKYIP